ncbi:hypothetical protein HDU76_008455, partial [Blyttiomyces sp. JEL0837]
MPPAHQHWSKSQQPQLLTAVKQHHQKPYVPIKMNNNRSSSPRDWTPPTTVSNSNNMSGQRVSLPPISQLIGTTTGAGATNLLSPTHVSPPQNVNVSHHYQPVAGQQPQQPQQQHYQQQPTYVSVIQNPIVTSHSQHQSYVPSHPQQSQQQPQQAQQYTYQSSLSPTTVSTPPAAQVYSVHAPSNSSGSNMHAGIPNYAQRSALQSPPVATYQHQHQTQQQPQSYFSAQPHHTSNPNIVHQSGYQPQQQQTQHQYQQQPQPQQQQHQITYQNQSQNQQPQQLYHPQQQQQQTYTSGPAQAAAGSSSTASSASPSPASSHAFLPTEQYRHMSLSPPTQFNNGQYPQSQQQQQQQQTGQAPTGHWLFIPNANNSNAATTPTNYVNPSVVQNYNSGNNVQYQGSNVSGVAPPASSGQQTIVQTQQPQQPTTPISQPPPKSTRASSSTKQQKSSSGSNVNSQSHSSQSNVHTGSSTSTSSYGNQTKDREKISSRVVGGGVVKKITLWKPKAPPSSSKTATTAMATSPELVDELNEGGTHVKSEKKGGKGTGAAGGKSKGRPRGGSIGSVSGGVQTPTMPTIASIIDEPNSTPTTSSTAGAGVLSMPTILPIKPEPTPDYHEVDEGNVECEEIEIVVPSGIVLRAKVWKNTSKKGGKGSHEVKSEVEGEEEVGSSSCVETEDKDQFRILACHGW